MTLEHLRRTLAELDAKGVWAFYLATLRLLFREKEVTLLKGLRAGVQAGALVRVTRGLYVNPAARSMPAEPLTHLAAMIRPYDFNYLSLETVASEAAVISQMPNRLTLMSTGKSATMATPLGMIEFVKTQRAASADDPGIQFDPGRGVCVASPRVAVRDLRRCGRSLDLIRPEYLDGAAA